MLDRYRAWRWDTTSTPEWMWPRLEGRQTDRKVRLFAAACGRVALVELSRVAATFREFEPPDPAAVLRVAEDYADGTGAAELDDANRRAERSAELCRTHMHEWDLSIYRSIYPTLQLLAWLTATRVDGLPPGLDPAMQCQVLRDVFGNPFRPVAVEPGWLTSTVVALARGIYADRAFDGLPILADALQEAGCDNDDVLNHCRGSGLHGRGCWVVDLVLGKA